MKDKFIKPYGSKKRVRTKNDKPTMTKQSLIANADINQLIKRHGLTHVQTNMANLEVLYGQITSQDLQEAMQMNIDAQEAFQEVPADIRKQFGNDAGAFIDFATNPDNIKQLRDWGLAEPEINIVPDEPIPVII